jgi:hypothetical protein
VGRDEDGSVGHGQVVAGARTRVGLAVDEEVVQVYIHLYARAPAIEIEERLCAVLCGRERVRGGEHRRHTCMIFGSPLR